MKKLFYIVLVVILLMIVSYFVGGIRRNTLGVTDMSMGIGFNPEWLEDDVVFPHEDNSVIEARMPALDLEQVISNYNYKAYEQSRPRMSGEDTRTSGGISSVSGW